MSDLRRLLFANQTRAYEGYPLVISRSVALRYLKQYQMYGNSEQGVPAGYTPLESITFPSGAYIKTGIIPKTYDYEVGFKGAFGVTASGPNCAWGFMGDGTFPRWLCATHQNKYLLNANATVAFGDADTNTHTFVGRVYMKNSTPCWSSELDGAIEQNDKTLISTPSWEANTLEIYLGARNNQGAGGNYGLITANHWWCIKAGVMIADYIPAKRNSDNVLGMYDLVSNTFFTNAGTGTFTAGPVLPTPENPVDVISVGDKVVPAGYQELEYIGFNIRTAIATGVPAQETDRVIFEANINVDQGTGDKYLTYATNTWVDIAGNGTSWYVRFGSESSSSFAIFTGEIGQKNTYEVYKNNFDINGVSRATPSYSAISGDWEIGKVGNNCASGNYYRYTIKNNTTGEIRFNGIPAKRLSDSVVGMYDTVSQSFFTTSGPDTFTAGPEVPNYVIPVVATGTSGDPVTTPIYLNAPLRKVGTYADVLDYKKGQIIRNVGYKVLDGTEAWASALYPQTNAYRISWTGATAELGTIRYSGVRCTHFEDGGSASTTAPNKIFFANDLNINFPMISDFDTRDKCVQWLAAQYAAGTPVIVYYPLATPVTESIVAPALPTMAGSTTYTTETEVKPSNMKGVF